MSKRMHCEKYHADISESTCLARRRRSLEAGPVHFGHSRRDPGCATCEQGKAVMEIHHNKQLKPGGKKMEEKKATKVCNKCGEEKPMDQAHFNVHKGCADGFENSCKECRNAQARERKKRGQTGPKQVKQGQPAMKKQEKTAETYQLYDLAFSTKPNVVFIDFGDHPQLLEAVKKKAAAEIRPVENQILFEIKTVFTEAV